MSFQEVLRHLQPYQPRALSALAPLASAGERILARWPDAVKEPLSNDRERIVCEMLRRLQQNDWTNLYTAFVTSAAVALFDVDRRDRDDLVKLRKFYYGEITANESVTFRSAMVAVYIGSYVPGAAHTRALAKALRLVSDRLNSQMTGLLNAVPKLFDPSQAHRQVAQLMVEMPNPWTGLKSINLRSPHAPGLMTHAHLAFVRAIAPQLTLESKIEKLFDWLRPEGSQPRSEGASEAISALLAAWKAGDPPDDLKTDLTTRITGLYGDPRTRGKEAPWGTVPEELVEQLSRWLTGENIRFFMDIVSAVETSHMWEPRRRFWLKLHQQKQIDAAWVALSDDGAALARERGARRPGLKFGRQLAGGNRTRTCLLILRVGQKIVVEGSHSYKVHIFDGRSDRAPKLYLSSYDCEEIRFIPGAQAKSHHVGWEGWVLERI